MVLAQCSTKSPKKKATFIFIYISQPGFGPQRCAPHGGKGTAEAPDIPSSFMGIRRKGTVSAATTPPIRPSKKFPEMGHLTGLVGEASDLKVMSSRPM